MMAPDYARVAEIVAAASAVQGLERARYLAAACAGDAALRADVDALLAQEAHVPGILGTAAGLRAVTGGLPTDEGDAGQEALPESIGPYLVRAVLGEGGMGTVYRAEQVAPIRRDVALKLVRRGLDTDRIVARFGAERQTLALMDHPAIAKVLDAGASADGRPYFVMELVEGTPVTTLCESRRLGIPERLSLFLAICAGVQHAHQKGIVHRDLKPSNLLVREQDGRLAPRIIDFGIAKAIEGDTHAGPLLTMAGDVVGTPEYMSPEQAGILGGGVDTRTDVYALGVILYELLTGRRPRSFVSGSVAEIQRVLAGDAPLRPSHAAPARARALVGDLDNIVLKAIAFAPADRYDSVEQLSDDVRRHLDGLPVRARAATWPYRTGKFVRRHWAGVAVAAVVTVLLSGSAAVLAVQASRLAAERDRALAAERRALAEATTAARVTEFLVDVFEVSDPSESRGNSVTVREVLDRGAAQLETGLAEQPEVRATLQDAVGRVYQNLGLPKVAKALLEAALAGRRAVFGNDHVSVGESLDRLARLEREIGAGGDVEAMYREALAIKRSALGPSHASVALTLNNLANAIKDRGDFPAAEALAREALDMRRTLLGPDHPDVAESLHDLGSILFFKGDEPGAEEHVRAALDLDRRIHGEDHPVVAVGWNSLGQVRLARGDLAGAETALRRSHTLVERLYGHEHREVALSLIDLGDLLAAQGRFDEAEALFQESSGVSTRLSGRTSHGVAMAEVNLARLNQQRNDLPAAERHFRQYLAICRAIYGAEDQRTASAMSSLASVVRLQGRLDDAEPLARDALAAVRAAVGPTNRLTANAIEELGLIARARRRLGEAEGYFREAVEVRRAALSAEHPELATSLFRWGRALVEGGQLGAAVAPLEEALRIRRATLPEGDLGITQIEALLNPLR
jgi:tetratricopeptide (TPR) repeat protein